MAYVTTEITILNGDKEYKVSVWERIDRVQINAPLEDLKQLLSGTGTPSGILERALMETGLLPRRP